MLHRAESATATPNGTHGLRRGHGGHRPEPTTGKKSGLLLFVLLIAQLMVILDITAVNIALPSLASDLQLTGSDISPYRTQEVAGSSPASSIRRNGC